MRYESNIGGHFMTLFTKIAFFISGWILIGIPFIALSFLSLPEWDNTYKIMGLITILSIIILLYLIGWFSAKKNEKAVVLLGCLFLTFAPLFHLYWQKTEFNRAIQMQIEYESKLDNLRLYREEFNPIDYEKSIKHYQFQYQIADAKSSDASLWLNRSPWLNISLSIIGAILSVIIAYTIKNADDQNSSVDQINIYHS